MNNRFLVYLFILILPNLSFSQKEVFLDENNNDINFEILKKKCEAEMFFCLTYSTDSLIVNKVHRKHYFGKLTKKEFSALKEMMNISNEEKMLDNYFLIFSDTLYNNKERLRLYQKHVIKHEKELKADTTNTIRIGHRKLTEKILERKYNRAAKKYTKCRKRLAKKFHSDIYLLYTHDKGYLKNHSEFNWKKDSINFIKNLKFTTSVNAYNMILRPNGEYYLSCCYNDKNNFERLLNSEDWSKIKNDYNASINTLSKRGIGFFKKSNDLFVKSECHINF